jgi:serine/threonine protein kinase
VTNRPTFVFYAKRGLQPAFVTRMSPRCSAWAEPVQSYFYAMEFVEGETLENLIKRSGQLKFKLVLEIAAQVAAGLGAVHKRKLRHAFVLDGSPLCWKCSDYPNRCWNHSTTKLRAFLIAR